MDRNKPEALKAARFCAGEVAPSGLPTVLFRFSGLTPWAKLYRRFAAGSWEFASGARVFE